MAQASSSSSNAGTNTNTGTNSQSVSYRINLSIRNNDTSTEMRDDALSCFVVVLTFWFFASMTLILGVYGSTELTLGPNTSRLIQTNSIFVQEIQVNEEGESQNGPNLYGFNEMPPLDVLISWYETHNVSVQANFHKDWVYYLHKGAHINISYTVKSEELYPLNLIIAQGKEELIQWVQNPSQPSNTLSWNLIYGNGTITQEIEKTSDYFIALGNLNNLPVEVQLEFEIRTYLYNTTGAYYKCSVNNKQCSLKLRILNPIYAILSTPCPSNESNAWNVKLSYAPRWITYFIGTAILTILILLAYKISNTLLYSNNNVQNQQNQGSDRRAPLLMNKEEDNLSLGSSYESVSHDEEEDLSEELLKKEAEKFKENNGCLLCVICCDNQRDCFFLPCGHSATCYICGLRILDEAGNCPICRRKMKKVRKIFTV